MALYYVPAEESVDYKVMLCAEMLSFAAGSCLLTQDKRASEIKNQLRFFFTDKQIEEAVSIITHSREVEKCAAPNANQN